MLCMMCHNEVATIHITEKLADKTVKLHLCSKCANINIDIFKKELLAKSLVNNKENTPLFTEREGMIKCPLCKITYAYFKEKGRLGCAHCYVTFADKLTSLCKRIHGSTHHRGKEPSFTPKTVDVRMQIQELRNQLEKAILLEEYEEAGRIRDALFRMEMQDKEG